MTVDEKERVSGEVDRDPIELAPVLPTVEPTAQKAEPSKPALHPAVYVAIWITLSSTVIVFNKWLLHTKHFDFPIILTTWHLGFATVMTQILARTTTLLDGRKRVKMTGRIYLRAIVPIGFFFSLSLICGNVTYLYLSVAFIQMLKATISVAVLITSWALGVAKPNLKVLFNVSFIVLGVVIASFGEVQFVFVGFLFQLGGIVFEAIRLVLVQKILSSEEFKMDPLVSLYYYAPVCAIMNFAVSVFTELPRLHLSQIVDTGLWTLLANAMVAFCLNVSVVFLIGKTSSLVFTLCGVLKDILLVAASMLIWADPVSPLQFFGYSIALGGLVYYKLGAEQITEHLSNAGRAWAEFGVKRPAARKLAIGGMVVFILLAALHLLTPGGSMSSIGNIPTYLANSRKAGGT